MTEVWTEAEPFDYADDTDPYTGGEVGEPQSPKDVPCTFCGDPSKRTIVVPSANDEGQVNEVVLGLCPSHDASLQRGGDLWGEVDAS